jgi:hypothetical protein
MTTLIAVEPFEHRPCLSPLPPFRSSRSQVRNPNSPGSCARKAPPVFGSHPAAFCPLLAASSPLLSAICLLPPALSTFGRRNRNHESSAALAVGGVRRREHLLCCAASVGVASGVHANSSIHRGPQRQAHVGRA